MSKIIIVEPNSNDKDQVRGYMVKGEKGYSAYDLYVLNGGTLTEEQWLDAFLNANNYYTKAEVNTLLDNYEVLTGTFDPEESIGGLLPIADYPTGYTKDNCCVISFMKKSGNNWQSIANETASDVLGTLPSVQLTSSKIAINDTVASANETTYDYKIVLMKIS